jgi:glycosyltransferase involved in cell wall biosynthesis
MEEPYVLKRRINKLMKNVTLLLPVKNGSKFLSASLGNLIEIAEDHDEILIVNDFSTDDSLDLIQKHQRHDQRIRVINNVNAGLVNALNIGIKESSNNWIARCDVDDTYDAKRIVIQKKAINSGIAGIFTDYEFFADGNKSLGIMPSAINSESVSVSLSKSQRTAHPSIMYSKEAVLSAGGYREEDFPTEDLSLWLRMSKEGKLISIPKVLLNYRLTPKSVSMQKRGLIQEKTRNLLSTIGINSKDFLYTYSNLELILDNYNNFESSTRRKMLLLRELLEIQGDPSRFGIGKNQNFHLLKYMKLLFNGKFLAEGISLKRERDLRNKFRFSETNVR